MIRQPRVLLVVLAVLLPAYLALTTVIYWQWFQPPPVRIVSFGPLTNTPVSTIDEAERQAIVEAKADSIVFIFQSWCLDRAVPGIVSAAWMNGIVHSLPDRATIGATGCYTKSFPVRVPHVQVPTDFTLRKKITYRSNPIREHVVAYPDLTLRVLP